MYVKKVCEIVEVINFYEKKETIEEKRLSIDENFNVSKSDIKSLIIKDIRERFPNLDEDVLRKTFEEKTKIEFPIVTNEENSENNGEFDGEMLILEEFYKYGDYYRTTYVVSEEL